MLMRKLKVESVSDMMRNNAVCSVSYTHLDFVRKFFCLEIYQTACVFPVFKDMHYGIGRPLALIAGVVAAGAARPAVFQRPPVSYTHLDVYKRQVSHRVVALFIPTALSFASRQI